MHGGNSTLALLGPEIGDHAILAEHETSRGWSALRVVPRAEVAVELATPAVQYALSVFEGLKAFRDPRGELHLFRAGSHAARLRRSAARLCMPELPEETFVRACSLAVASHAAMVPECGRGSLYLRPTLYGSEEYLGVRGANVHRFAVVVTTGGALTLRTIRLRVEPEYVRAAPGGIGAAKAGANYAGALFAQRLARRDGFDDVLWLDATHHRDVGEAGTMNVFFAFADGVATPALDGTILPGITRDSCLTLLREWGVPAAERTVPLSEVESRARAGELLEVFGVSTALRLVQVGEIVHRDATLRPRGGDLARRLFDALGAVQDGHAADPHGWREPVTTEQALTATNGR
jgi:branched-chain amino acid aminotransferase